MGCHGFLIEQAVPLPIGHIHASSDGGYLFGESNCASDSDAKDIGRNEQLNCSRRGKDLHFIGFDELAMVHTIFAPTLLSQIERIVYNVFMLQA